jgi:hypothetical protein
VSAADAVNFDFLFESASKDIFPTCKASNIVEESRGTSDYKVPIYQERKVLNDPILGLVFLEAAPLIRCEE